MTSFRRSLGLFASSSENLATSASSGGGAAAKVTLSAPGSTLQRRYLDSMIWSFDSTAAISRLRVFAGTTSAGPLLMDIDDAGAGPGRSLRLLSPIGAPPGQAVIVELAQPGSSMIARLNAYGYVE